MRGLTLIETILYCALFAMLVTGACYSAVILGEATTRTKSHAKNITDRIYQEDVSTASSSFFLLP